jgi:uncharacterized protein
MTNPDVPRSTMADAARVIHKADAQSFVVEGAEETAVLTYRELGDHLTILHTEVGPEHEGKGYGGLLVRSVLDYARQRKLRVIPACKFARTYIARHKEYADLVDVS